MGLDNWQVGDDGMPYRQAARVCALSADKLLLVRGHDYADPSRTWWFTVGGGLEPTETARAGAAREFYEETGIRLDPASLVGPVIERRGLFRFRERPARQDEQFFLAFLPPELSEKPLDRAGWTAHECEVLDALRWFSLEELRREAERTQIYPPLLPELFARWLAGWDGHVEHIDEV